MEYKTLSRGLGWFSLALGAAELLAGRRIAARLSAEQATGVVQAFGAREVASGLALLGDVSSPRRLGLRVAGDALDAGALALAARRAPRNPWVWGAIGFVAAAALADVLVTRGLAAEAEVTPA